MGSEAKVVQTLGSLTTVTSIAWIWCWMKSLGISKSPAIAHGPRYYVHGVWKQQLVWVRIACRINITPSINNTRGRCSARLLKFPVEPKYYNQWNCLYLFRGGECSLYHNCKFHWKECLKKYILRWGLRCKQAKQLTVWAKNQLLVKFKPPLLINISLL